jgi:hypothetical protein
VATCGQRVIEAVFLPGDVAVGAAGDVVEFFPFRPLRVGPLAWPPTGQRADRGDVSEAVGVVGGELIPVLALADQPGLEVPEPVVAAEAVRDQAGGAPHCVGVDREPRGVQVDLEVDDMSGQDTAEPVLQPPGTLPRTGRLPGGALQKEPEFVDVHAGNSNGRGVGVHSSEASRIKRSHHVAHQAEPGSRLQTATCSERPSSRPGCESRPGP